jgi:hypothetical protein
MHHCEPLYGPGPHIALGILCPGAATPTTPCYLSPTMNKGKDKGKQVRAGTKRNVGDGIIATCVAGAWNYTSATNVGRDTGGSKA